MMVDPSGCSSVWWNPLSWFDNVSNVGKIIIGAVLFVGAVALTVATGGALAPVFITMAVGVGVSTAVGGFSAVIASGGDWSQFGQGAWDGFADGVLWGGIFSFAGASVGAIKYAAKGGQGALQGTTKLTTITKGQQFDRFGHLGGKFITNAGTPASQLALPAANTGVKTTLQATKNFRAFTGVVANGFGGTGGGTQYVMRYSIQTLLKKGWLIKFSGAVIMTDYTNTISVGLHLSSPKVLIPWGESKEKVLSNFSSDSITNPSDRFYSIKGSLFDGELNGSIIMQFSQESKLIATGIVNENNDGSEESVKCSFEEVQAILEKYFGKPSKPPMLTQFFTKMNKGDKEYRWHFKNVTVVHKLWDRFGLEENIEILCN